MGAGAPQSEVFGTTLTTVTEEVWIGSLRKDSPRVTTDLSVPLILAAAHSTGSADPAIPAPRHPAGSSMPESKRRRIDAKCVPACVSVSGAGPRNDAGNFPPSPSSPQLPASAEPARTLRSATAAAPNSTAAAINTTEASPLPGEAVGGAGPAAAAAAPAPGADPPADPPTSDPVQTGPSTRCTTRGRSSSCKTNTKVQTESGNDAIVKANGGSRRRARPSGEPASSPPRPPPAGVPEKLGDRPLRLIIVGHNPSAHAWQSGHYYSNPSNHMWRLLISTGIAPPGTRGAEDDDRLPAAAGVGFLDVGCGHPGTDRCGAVRWRPKGGQERSGAGR